MLRELTDVLSSGLFDPIGIHQPAVLEQRIIRIFVDPLNGIEKLPKDILKDCKKLRQALMLRLPQAS
ncbi:hypothetical protein D3C75_626860 [compost metagenome]